MFCDSECFISISKLCWTMKSISSWAIRAWNDRSLKGRGSRGTPAAWGVVWKKLWWLTGPAVDGRGRYTLLRLSLSIDGLARPGVNAEGV